MTRPNSQYNLHDFFHYHSFLPNNQARTGSKSTIFTSIEWTTLDTFDCSFFFHPPSLMGPMMYNYDKIAILFSCALIRGRAVIRLVTLLPDLDLPEIISITSTIWTSWVIHNLRFKNLYAITIKTNVSSFTKQERFSFHSPQYFTSF